jgi:8-amino-7-oxononanoate synthase
MNQIQQLPGRTLMQNKTELLWFGGTSYLGIPHNAQFQSLIKSGLDIYGANWGSSRNNPVQIDVYEKVESFLAEFASAPASLTTSSGMLAGQIVLNFLKNEYTNTSIIFAPRVHPALWTIDYVPDNQSFVQFVANINSRIENCKNGNIIIVADSVSSPHYEAYDFEWIQNLPQNKKIFLVIDDSHSLGILGKNGAGVFASIMPPKNVEILVVASLNKALGTPGGVIFGEKDIIKRIRKTPFFSGCSPMSPAFAYACTLGKIIYAEALKKLLENINYFNEITLKYSLFENTKGHPAYCFNEKGLNEYFIENNIFVPYFGYPNPESEPINRLVISSLHSFNDLDKIEITLNNFYNK